MSEDWQTVVATTGKKSLQDFFHKKKLRERTNYYTHFCKHFHFGNKLNAYIKKIRYLHNIAKITL